MEKEQTIAVPETEKDIPKRATTTIKTNSQTMGISSSIAILTRTLLK
jgi:hypothetical protein